MVKKGINYINICNIYKFSPFFAEIFILKKNVFKKYG